MGEKNIIGNAEIIGNVEKSYGNIDLSLRMLKNHCERCQVTRESRFVIENAKKSVGKLVCHWKRPYLGLAAPT